MYIYVYLYTDLFTPSVLLVSQPTTSPASVGSPSLPSASNSLRSPARSLTRPGSGGVQGVAFR